MQTKSKHYKLCFASEKFYFGTLLKGELSMDIDNKLKSVLQQVAEIEFLSEDINDSTDIMSDLNYDSIRFINLIIAIETAFGISIDIDDLDMEYISKYSNLRSVVLKKIS